MFFTLKARIPEEINKQNYLALHAQRDSFPSGDRRLKR
jgi:hypothetical protein